MFDLTGKTALLTGASGGIGGAIARALVAQGAQVALSGTRIEALEALAAELGPQAKPFAANLSDAAAIEGLVGAVEAGLGPVDILISNAGLTRDGLLLRMKDEDWETVMAVNLTAYFRLAKVAMKGMIRRRTGRIIGIASVVGVMGNAGQANYAASKAGMIGFTKSLAQEVASRNVTANVVAPGFITSPMTDALNEQQKAKMFERIPAGRFGEGSDVAAAVVYLASDAAGYMTGQTLHVNGGMHMI
jgi:3-oxoacyl-[acyl-carrier protein] reductase